MNRIWMVRLAGALVLLAMLLLLANLHAKLVRLQHGKAAATQRH